ncbi:MAG: N-formylglutamate deformylase [Devosia sp.]|nr:N-formylglutamate deformylase [Devosia sp.]
MSVFAVQQGKSPIILAFPHTSAALPQGVRERLNEIGQRLTDTDWHVHELYAGLLPDASTVRALFHRYVIDANRDPADVSLYPGQNTTGLVPRTDFDGQSIWRDGQAPDDAEIASRLELFHAPYHAALAAEIARVKAQHGVAILFDCHSIRSTVPFLFAGKLPDMNVGTVRGISCDAAIEAAVFDVARKAPGYSSVLNGRFKGGWTTRHYGRPQQNVHAIQLELAQETHLGEERAPFALDGAKAARLRPHLAKMLERLEAIAPELAKAAS